MSGGSMDWLYLRVRDANFKLNSPERVAFRHHLMLVAKALQSIEWNDSGDGDDQEVPNIMACIALSAEENKLLRAEIKRLRTVYVLIVSEEAGPVDSATCWHEDKIIGCYINRESAEGAAKLLTADWRINEYALEGKP